jgi:competence protein ComEA
MVMITMRRALFTIAGLALAATVQARVQGGQTQSPGPSGEGLPDAPGKDVTVRACGLCHEARRAASLRLTRDGWAEVIDGMMKRGARLSDDDFKVVLDYLSTQFAGEAARPINVNAAPQIDLESVAGLLRSEARAIIEYREKNGPFKSLDDLKKVPGLDFSKIDSRRDFLVAM